MLHKLEGNSTEEELVKFMKTRYAKFVKRLIQLKRGATNVVSFNLEKSKWYATKNDLKQRIGINWY
jgi:hypothetical protein